MRGRDREADAAALDRATDEALALLSDAHASGAHGGAEEQVVAVEGGYLPFEEPEGGAGAPVGDAFDGGTSGVAPDARGTAVPGARDARTLPGAPGVAETPEERPGAGEALTDVWRSIREVAGADEPSLARDAVGVGARPPGSAPSCSPGGEPDGGHRGAEALTDVWRSIRDMTGGTGGHEGPRSGSASGSASGPLRNGVGAAGEPDTDAGEGLTDIWRSVRDAVVSGGSPRAGGDDGSTAPVRGPEAPAGATAPGAGNDDEDPRRGRRRQPVGGHEELTDVWRSVCDVTIGMDDGERRPAHGGGSGVGGGEPGPDGPAGPRQGRGGTRRSAKPPKTARTSPPPAHADGTGATGHRKGNGNGNVNGNGNGADSPLGKEHAAGDRPADADAKVGADLKTGANVTSGADVKAGADGKPGTDADAVRGTTAASEHEPRRHPDRSRPPTASPRRPMPWAMAGGVAAGAAEPLPALTSPLADAVGRTLAAPLTALTDLPSFDTSAMDGWAVAGPGPWRLPEDAGQGIVAGQTGDDALRDGHAVPIATGARIPAGATAVLRSEHGRTSGNELHTTRRTAQGQDIRPRGQECRRDDELLPAGTLITPAVLGLAAAAGHDELPVTARPRVLIVVLGDELVHEGLPQDGRIRDALGPMLAPWLRALGAEAIDTVRLGDDADALHDTLAATDADLVITTGGTASGPRDHLHPTLRRLDAELLVDGVAVRPGHPMLLARLTPERHLVGLPGNPLAAVAGLLTLAEPLLRGLSGRAAPSLRRAALSGPVPSHPTDTRLVPVVLRGGDGARPLRFHGPAMLRGLAAADAIAVIPPGGSTARGRVALLDLPWTATGGGVG
ncbi:molybdopterin molybdotransferase MoeA [Streptomyces mobaraensis]|uniref:molybdopterin molybdotransferase MoeA n=1 Tax=Streptomyces mobaraensis TaxID=35621 RepID=UPI0033289340